MVNLTIFDCLIIAGAIFGMSRLMRLLTTKFILRMQAKKRKAHS